MIKQPATSPDASLCINLCEIASPNASAAELEQIIADTCLEAGFPYCERIYVGSYFCENYFIGLTDVFHDSVRDLCRRYDLHATLVIPIIGQAFLERADRRIAQIANEYVDLYDEVIVNDIGTFTELASTTRGAKPIFADHQDSNFHKWSPRIGLGRLFSKNQRDPRYPEAFESQGIPTLSAEALSCLDILASEQAHLRPLVEVDPTNAIVNVSELVNPTNHVMQSGCQSGGPDTRIDAIAGPSMSDAHGDASSADTANCGKSAHQTTEIAIHLPFCYATTGRNCGPASLDEPDSEKFRLGRGCSRHCLRMAQGYLTDEGVRYIKHGRAYYFENPTCQIAGTDSWRIVYAATHETMRPSNAVTPYGAAL